MELQEFISTTLVQIARGIEDAAKQLLDTKAIVNPRNVRPMPDRSDTVYGILNTEKQFHKIVQKIDFDVAVTAEKGSKTKGGVGIQVGSIGVGTQAQSDRTSSTISRIKFSIPMVLPMEDAPFDKEDREKITSD